MVPEKSSVEFKIKNWGMTVDGKLGGLEVSGIWYPDSPSKSSLRGTVKTKTIDANIDARNESLRGEDYFDVEQFPEIRISSESILKTETGFLFKGTLEMKGITKNIEIPFKVSSSEGLLVLTGKFEIDRLVYNVGSSSMVMGDHVQVFLQCTLKTKN